LAAAHAEVSGNKTEYHTQLYSPSKAAKI